MKQKKKQVHLIIGLLQFRNINLISKGCYKLNIEAFTSQKPMTLGYSFNEDLQEEKLELRNNYSTKVECHSDQDEQGVSQKSTSCIQKDNTNAFLSLPFFVKYHCERIKLKSMALFTQSTAEEMIDIKITLFRKETKLMSSDNFQLLESIQFSVNCTDHYLEQKEIFIPAPECCTIKIAVLSCPIVYYEQLYGNCLEAIKQTRSKKAQQNKQILLQQIRKLVKKQRYETFILKKQLYQVLKTPQSEPITLPLHFVQKQNMSMDEVQTSQLKFFKYLAFYQRYYTSSQMLKQQMEHINFDKINIIKNFIDGFEKQELLLTVLEEKEKLIAYKKFRNYIITNEITSSVEKMLTKYSTEEFKAKKDKIKQIDATIYYGAHFNDHIVETNFVSEKQTKKNPNNEKQILKYPIVFRDLFIVAKQNKMRTDTSMVCVLSKKIRKKKRYFIFAHGFQGLPIDLSYLINMIRFANQKIKTFVLKSYKNHMNESIETMAMKAAQEIEGIFKKIDLAQIQPEITFIGHSMGPIILRAALKHLTHFSEYYEAFISICAPHLGYIQGTKFLTEAGLSIISKLKPIESLNQLSNRDNTDLEKTFIYKLSREGSLKNFKRLTLIASMDDDYVPWHSARIQPFLQKGTKEKIQKQMISNIFGIGLKETKIQKIERIQISFPHEKQKSLNSLIGRTSHIKPLSDRGFLEILSRQLLFN